MKWQWRVDRPTPSLNNYQYSHWRVAQRDKLEWWWLIGTALNKLESKPTKAEGKRKLTVIRYGIRKLDSQDNGTGGLKGIIDNIKKMGLLVDDSDQWFVLEFINGTKPKGQKPHTIFILEDVE